MSKSELSKLMIRADKWFSDYVRKRDADHRGLVRCCTCNKLKFWKDIDCGHFMTRDAKSTRYDEKNTGPQCKLCNGPKGGRQYEFALYLDKKYGPGTAEQMRIKSKIPSFRKRYDYLVLIEEFKTKFNSLKN